MTWHPREYLWDGPAYDYDQAISATATGQTWVEPWSVGARKGGIYPGDYAFLYRQYRDL